MVEGRRAVALIALVVAAAVGAIYVIPGPDGDGEPAAPPDHGCPNAREQPARDVDAAERATLCLLNAERRARGLRPLRPDPKLRVAALRHSTDMVERDFLEHVNPDGVGHHERIVATGYRLHPGGFATGENLASGRAGETSTPAVVVYGWMHSPGHRRNVLRPDFEEIGIGIVPNAQGGGPGATYTTTFAGRATAAG